MHDKNIQEVAPAAAYSHPAAAVQRSTPTASLSGMGAFPVSSQGPPWVGSGVPRQQWAWEAHPCPCFQQQGCPEPPTRAGATTPAAGHWGQPGAKGVPSTLPYPPPLPQHLEHFGRQEGQEITNLWSKPVKRLCPAVDLSHSQGDTPRPH